MSTSNAHEDPALAMADDVGYERSEPNAIKIAIVTALIVFTIVASCYAVYYWYVTQLEATRHNEIEIPIWQDLKDVRAAETERLTQYKFIDKSMGNVQLPIARSMELFIQEADAGKSFYKGASEAVKPREIDPNLQTVIDKALGKTTTAPPVDAPATPVAKTAASAAKSANPAMKR